MTDSNAANDQESCDCIQGRNGGWGYSILATSKDFDPDEPGIWILNDGSEVYTAGDALRLALMLRATQTACDTDIPPDTA